MIITPDKQQSIRMIDRIRGLDVSIYHNEMYSTCKIQGIVFIIVLEFYIVGRTLSAFRGKITECEWSSVIFDWQRTSLEVPIIIFPWTTRKMQIAPIRIIHNLEIHDQKGHYWLEFQTLSLLICWILIPLTRVLTMPQWMDTIVSFFDYSITLLRWNHISWWNELQRRTISIQLSMSKS